MSGKALKKAVLAKLEACTSGAALKRVLDSDECEDATYGEAPMYREGAQILVDKAKTWTKPNDVAAAMMWLARLGAFAPHRIIRDNEQVKERVAKVLEAERGFFRGALTHKAAAVRVAAGHALACCRNADARDLAALESRWDEERDAAALATVAMAAGVIAHRLGGALDDTRRAAIAERATACFEHADTVVRLCAVIAVALLDPKVSERAVAILEEAIASPAKLPKQWGWFWMRGVLDTRDAAGEMCARVRPADPTALFDALLDARRALPDDRGLCAAMMQTAFPDLSPSGIAREELDEMQRRAVASLAQAPDEGWLERLGLNRRGWQEHFLAGDHPEWRPLDVTTHDGPRRWHFHKIWDAHRCGELSEKQAVDAIVRGLEPQTVMDVVIDAGRDWYEEGQRLVIALSERLERDGLDVVAAAEAAYDKSKSENDLNWAIAALSAYRLRGERPPKDLDEVIVEGLGRLHVPAPLDELLLHLDADRRERILLAEYEELDDDWPWNGMLVAHTAFTKSVAKAVVEKVTVMPEQFDAAVALIARTGNKGRKQLAKLKLNKKLTKTRDALLAATPSA